MIIKVDTSGKVHVYSVSKSVSDEQMSARSGTYVTPAQISTVLTHDADVFIEPGHKLLLRFRKNVLSRPAIDAFYDNVIQFAKTPTTTRGLASRSIGAKNVRTNAKTMTNIFGFMDGFSPRQKFMIANHQRAHPSMKTPLAVRACRFNTDYPEQYQKTIPLITEIDGMYKKMLPTQYAAQHKKSRQTHFKIADTSFTTVTTNVNFQTALHMDRGDDAEGFGNLTVISKGAYSGAQTCFPQYGVGVDVQMGDMLFMDVHQWHGNLPMKNCKKMGGDEVIRMSVVCYLRTRLWEKTKGLSKQFMNKHLQQLKSMRSSTTRKAQRKKQGHPATRKRR